MREGVEREGVIKHHEPMIGIPVVPVAGRVQVSLREVAERGEVITHEPIIGIPVMPVARRVQASLRKGVAKRCLFLVGHRHAVCDAEVLQLVRQYIVIR